IAAVCGCLAVATLSSRPAAQGLPFTLFERYLDSLRQETGVTGLSAAIVQDGREVWEVGLGKQDIENNIFARPDTPYLIGQLTQSLTAIVLGQCVERAGLSIAQPVRRWTSDIPEAGATVFHVLAHTSAGVPGDAFRFDTDRFGALSSVAEDCSERPYRAAVAEDIFDRLGMKDSVPGRDLGVLSQTDNRYFDDNLLRTYGDVLKRLAAPYRVDRSGRATRSEYPAEAVTAATGLVSTVRDLARFEMALDADDLVGRDLRTVAWTNVTSNSGASLPLGLGWFVQSYNGTRLVWQFGNLRDAGSSLVIKVPDRGVTLIMLANSDGLGPADALAAGDVTASLFAKLFLRLFVS
ncbi:MAG: serine hydrolase domain-containing protein, partial [Vicinamibacterales bacterium]